MVRLGLDIGEAREGFSRLKRIATSVRGEIEGNGMLWFRRGLGLLFAGSALRTLALGWVEEHYLKPTFHLTYFGFELVHVPTAWVVYLLFGVQIVSGILIVLGVAYRAALLAYLVSFGWVFLMDATWYLNHHYFILCMVGVLLLLPMPSTNSRGISLRNGRHGKGGNFPKWGVLILQMQVGFWYVSAGLAKVQSDWLLHAQPMRIWLSALTDLPLIGPALAPEWVAYVASWAGCLFDCTVPFFLAARATRWWAYGAVVVFHTTVGVFFQIGVFPFLMVICALVFLVSIPEIIGNKKKEKNGDVGMSFTPWGLRVTISAMLFFFGLLQIGLALRSHYYMGKVLWHEQGFRFSQRVMLMEKAGVATFFLGDKENEKIVDNGQFLTPIQERMMATQPDFILQYAHFLAQRFKTRRVRAEVFATLNGRLSRPLISDTVNLALLQDGWGDKTWILP
jgi:hypothetical protein